MSYQDPDPFPETTSNPLVTFACGAIAGAVMALMFAPSTGRDTRAFLAKRSRRAAEKGRELVERSPRVSEVLEQGRSKVSEFGDRIGQAVEQGKAGYREAMRQGQTLANDVVKSAGEAAHVLCGSRPADSTT